MASSHRMPFGKHKGKPLSEVPYDYLRWLLDKADDIKPWLREAIEDELALRVGETRHRQQRRPDPEPRPRSYPPMDWEAIVRTWYRDLCLAHHPDRGGSHEAMKAINDAHDRLKKLVGI